MIEIEQAIYGDKDGGYGYLNSSFSDLSTPRRIGNSTDVLDKPRSGILSKPIIRMFIKDDYYLVVKSFPQSGKRIRDGRVFSHALFIEAKDLTRINNLEEVLGFLMPEISFPEEMDTILLEPDSKPQTQKDYALFGRIAYGIKGLLEMPHDQNHTLVWVGHQGFWRFVNLVWAELPAKIRRRTRIGSAYDPRKVDTDSLSLLAIPEPLLPNWAMTQHYLIEEESTYHLKGPAEFYFVSDSVFGQQLRKMLEDYGIQLEKIWHLRILESQLEVYVEGCENLGQLLFFADLISKMSPNPEVGEIAKNELLDRLADLLPKGKGEEVLALRHANLQGFKHCESRLQPALESWCEHLLAIGLEDRSIPELVLDVFKTDEHIAWWQLCIKTNMTDWFRSWETMHGAIVWQWIIQDTRVKFLLDHLGQMELPVEDALVEHLPKDLSLVAESLLAYSEKYHWPRLHAVALLLQYPFSEAVSRQLSMEIELENGLREMAERVNPEVFFAECLVSSDKRMMALGGELLLKYPAFWEDLKVNDSSWRAVWKEANKRSGDPWIGISAPLDILYELLDLVVSGELLDDILMNQLSKGRINDLSEYPNRSVLWRKIPQSAFQGFAVSTILGVLHKGRWYDLEIELQGYLANDRHLTSIVNDASILLSKKLGLLKTVPTLKEYHVIELLQCHSIEPVESGWLGEWVRDKGWKGVADWMYTKRTQRQDLLPALGSCHVLLGTFEKVAWALRHSRQSLSRKDWIEAFTQVCCDLIPEGPAYNGIWESCGGRNAELLTNSNGRNQWEAALRYLFEGNNEATISCLLQSLLVEFPHNEKLKMLRNLKQN